MARVLGVFDPMSPEIVRDVSECISQLALTRMVKVFANVVSGIFCPRSRTGNSGTQELELLLDEEDEELLEDECELDDEDEEDELDDDELDDEDEEDEEEEDEEEDDE